MLGGFDASDVVRYQPVPTSGIIVLYPAAEFDELRNRLESIDLA